jgi:hypothetical protein
MVLEHKPNDLSRNFKGEGKGISEITKLILST